MKAWCQTCRTVDMVEAGTYRCLWCDTITLSQVFPNKGRESSFFTLSQLVALHDRYARGEGLATLAREVFTGRDTLKENFWAAGLPTRDVAASNALEAPRRKPGKKHGGENPAYRSDLCDRAIVEAYERTKSLKRAATELGCGVATVHRRLGLMGHPRRPVGVNQHGRGAPDERVELGHPVGIGVPAHRPTSKKDVTE